MTDGGWPHTENDDRGSYTEPELLEDPAGGGVLEDQGTTVTLPAWFGSGKGKKGRKRM
jgi:hypothetical protein